MLATIAVSLVVLTPISVLVVKDIRQATTGDRQAPAEQPLPK